jgi:hypothetical protein
MQLHFEVTLPTSVGVHNVLEYEGGCADISSYCTIQHWRIFLGCALISGASAVARW